MFQIGNLVGKRGKRSTHLGKITAIFHGSDEACVTFTVAIQPTACMECGEKYYLSENVVSGEIVCMATGCGYKHGFKRWDEVISFGKLINVSEQRFEEKKTKLKNQVAKILKSGLVEKLITAEQKTNILEILS